MNATAAEIPAAVPNGFLVAALRLDAVASAAMGVLLAAGAAWLDGVLDVPLALLVPLGIFLVGYGAALWFLAASGAPRPTSVKLVVAGNVAWILASIGVVVLDALTLSGLGTAFVLVQAAAVAGFAELQLIGLRRAR
jgi:hypothetical protein